MVRLMGEERINDTDSVFMLSAISTDTLPTETFAGRNIRGGSICTITDTGAAKTYNEDSKVWG